MSKLPVIIDTDMGIDDALAMLVAMRSSKLDIKLITTVAGNVPVDKVNANILFLSQIYKDTIPVAGGASRPLVKEPVFADDVHGESGLGKIVPMKVCKEVIDKDAVEAIKEVLDNSSEKITLITLGPLTNIANLVKKYPKCVEKIEKAYCMIGSYTGVGNITDYAEFNAYVDPDAIDYVVQSGLNIIFSPMELGWQVSIKKKEFLGRRVDTFEDYLVKHMIAGSMETVDPTLFCVHDLVTILGVINPEMFDFVKCDANYEKSGSDKFGKLFFPENPNGKFLVQKCKNIENVKKLVIKKVYGEESEKNSGRRKR